MCSNPAFSADAVEPAVALELLERNLADPNHSFWADDLSLREALAAFSSQIRGHRRITEAYLLALTIRRCGRLATFDRGVFALLADRREAGKHVELIA